MSDAPEIGNDVPAPGRVKLDILLFKKINPDSLDWNILDRFLWSANVVMRIEPDCGPGEYIMMRWNNGVESDNFTAGHFRHPIQALVHLLTAVMSSVQADRINALIETAIKNSES